MNGQAYTRDDANGNLFSVGMNSYTYAPINWLVEVSASFGYNGLDCG